MSNICYNDPTKPKMGLVLTGGGARAAYQVGALRAVSDIIYRKECGNPFPIITGTSAGAINATVLAAYARTPRLGIKNLQRVWSNFHVDQVFRADFPGVAKNSSHWLRSIFSNEYHKKHQVSLLDNSPLKKLLAKVIHYNNIQESIDSGQLHALSITASGYFSGQSISFFQGHPELKGWNRYRRCGSRAMIGREHLLASSAIPIVFPAIKINREFFGDGSLRFMAPISPAIHLNADKIFIIGVDPVKEEVDCRPESAHYPSIADIAGQVLDSVFIDSLHSDIERIERVNKTLKLIPGAVRDLQSNLRPIDTFTISPSKNISRLAGRHFNALPRLIRFFFNRIGIDADEGSTILSYLLFEAPYTQELISLGYNDAFRQKQAIIDFFDGWRYNRQV